MSLRFTWTLPWLNACPWALMLPAPFRCAMQCAPQANCRKSNNKKCLDARQGVGPLLVCDSCVKGYKKEEGLCRQKVRHVQGWGRWCRGGGLAACSAGRACGLPELRLTALHVHNMGQGCAGISA